MANAFGRNADGDGEWTADQLDFLSRISDSPSQGLTISLMYSSDPTASTVGTSKRVRFEMEDDSSFSSVSNSLTTNPTTLSSRSHPPKSILKGTKRMRTGDR